MTSRFLTQFGENSLLRIAFDLDGVLADMEAELVRQTEILFGAAKTRVLQDRARSGQAAAGSAERPPKPAGPRSADEPAPGAAAPAPPPPPTPRPVSSGCG